LYGFEITSTIFQRLTLSPSSGENKEEAEIPTQLSLLRKGSSEWVFPFLPYLTCISEMM